MKTAFTLLAAALLCLGAHAQSQFSVYLNGASEVPPNASPNWGSGSFTLSGDLLAWSIGFPDLSFTPVGASVHGPASASQTAAALFSLGTPTTGPGPQGGIVTFYQGSTSLLPAQIADLEAGQWYANILSVQYLGGEVRGQITPVPEPSTCAMVSFGVGAFFLARRCKTAARNIAVLATGLLAAATTPAQVISDGTSGGLVTVTADGKTNAGGQWIGPWVDIPPTMTYVDGLPIVREPPRPPLPGANTLPFTAPSFGGLLRGPANAFTNFITVPPGWSLIANPIFHSRGATLAVAVPDNSVAELLQHGP